MLVIHFMVSKLYIYLILEVFNTGKLFKYTFNMITFNATHKKTLYV